MAVTRDQLVIAVVIIVFNILGVFGNVNVVVATIRAKELQSKHGKFTHHEHVFAGILLAVLAFVHIFCLIGELVNLYHILFVSEVTEKQIK